MYPQVLAHMYTYLFKKNVYAYGNIQTVALNTVAVFRLMNDTSWHRSYHIFELLFLRHLFLFHSLHISMKMLNMIILLDVYIRNTLACTHVQTYAFMHVCVTLSLNCTALLPIVERVRVRSCSISESELVRSIRTIVSTWEPNAQPIREKQNSLDASGLLIDHYLCLNIIQKSIVHREPFLCGISLICFLENVALIFYYTPSKPNHD